MIPFEFDPGTGPGGGDLQQALERVQEVLAEADILAEAEALPGALACYQHAEKLLASLPITVEHTVCDWEMAGVLHRLGRYPEAAERYQRMISIHEMLGDEVRTLEALDRFGTCLSSMGRRREAIDVRLDARERRVEDEDWGIVGHIDLFIGCDLTELGRWDESIPRFRSALKLARTHGSGMDVGWANLMLARSLQEIGEHVPAEEHALQAIAAFTEARALEQAADALVALGSIRFDLGSERIDDSRAAYELALPIFVRSDEHLRASWTAEQIGILLAEVERCDEAVGFFCFAADCAVEADSPDDAADCWDGAARALCCLGRHAEAETYHRRALDTYIRLGLDDDVAICQSNLADTLEDIGRAAEALDCLQQARDHWDRRGETMEVARLDVRLGVALDHTGRLDESLAALRRARRVYADKRRPVDIAEVDLCLAWTLADLGDSDEAVAHARSARPVLLEAGWEEAVADCDQLLGRLLD